MCVRCQCGSCQQGREVYLGRRSQFGKVEGARNVREPAARGPVAIMWGSLTLAVVCSGASVCGGDWE